MCETKGVELVTHPPMRLDWSDPTTRTVQEVYAVTVKCGVLMQYVNTYVPCEDKIIDDRDEGSSIP